MRTTRARSRIHRKLRVEELEPRVHPTTLLLGPSGTETFSFQDKDRDDILVTFGGQAGDSVTLLDKKGQDIDDRDDIAQIIFNTASADTSLSIEVTGGRGKGAAEVGDITDAGILTIGSIRVQGAIGDVTVGNVADFLGTTASGKSGDNGG